LSYVEEKLKPPFNREDTMIEGLKIERTSAELNASGRY
jgi:hypothetical protein